MSRLPPERFARIVAFDGACVVALNRVLVNPRWQRPARLVSRMGDGELWGLMILAIALAPAPFGPRCALHFGMVALTGVLLYLLVKRRTGRLRPYARLDGLVSCGRPLDEFSFPSGHTLHAVAFTVVAAGYSAPLAAVLAVFALLTGIVRVVLGLHYPSDVLAGGALGGSIALASFVALPA